MDIKALRKGINLEFPEKTPPEFVSILCHTFLTGNVAITGT